MKKITIITATYNSASTIERCMSSVAEQRALSQVEHIIVDGGSADATLDIVQRFAHVGRVISEPDHGIYDAFNKGLALATGEYIYYLNSDDYLLGPQVMDEVLGALVQGELDYLSYPVLERDPVTSSVSVAPPVELMFEGRRIQKPCHQGFVARSQILRQLGGFPRCFTIVADTYLMLKVITCGKGKYINKPLACFNLAGFSTDIANLAQLNKELAYVYSLLNIDNSLSTEDEKVRLKVSVVNLKDFLAKVVNKAISPAVGSKKIALFGTGEMSVLITDILSRHHLKVEQYIVTQTFDVLFLNRPVVSLTDAIDAELVINTIEGPHFADINQQIKQHYPHVSVIRWNELYDYAS